jgi:hypothetical protein
MATGRGGNQGKTAFVTDHLRMHPDADEAAVNEAWAKAGNDGTISGSLVYKVRSGLRSSGKKGTGGVAAGKAATPKRRGRPPKGTRAGGSGTRGVERVSRAMSSGLDGTRGRERVLDRVEAGIDGLIFELLELGGMEEALEGLRKVRRVVVLSHEG